MKWQVQELMKRVFSKPNEQEGLSTKDIRILYQESSICGEIYIKTASRESVPIAK